MGKIKNKKYNFARGQRIIPKKYNFTGGRRIIRRRRIPPIDGGRTIFIANGVVSVVVMLIFSVSFSLLLIANLFCIVSSLGLLDFNKKKIYFFNFVFNFVLIFLISFIVHFFIDCLYLLVLRLLLRLLLCHHLMPKSLKL